MDDREADETMDMESDAAEELWDAQTEAAMLKYYAVKRLPGILDEFEYIRSAYPHIYETLADFAGELREDPVKTASKYREIFRERTGEEKITASSLDRFYKETYESGNVIWSSDDGSYVRTEKKVGRNDPCPCGSGKKYKRCCGRK